MPRYFQTIDRVEAPLFHVGQAVSVLATGKMVSAVIHRVTIYKKNVRLPGCQRAVAVHQWVYTVKVDGVTIMRLEDGSWGAIEPHPLYALSNDTAETFAASVGKGAPVGEI